MVRDMLDLATVKAPEVAEWAQDKRRAAFVAFAMGAQWALELAALDPEVARKLIEQIHASQTSDTAPEWNTNALAFIARCHGHRPPGSN